VNAPVVLIVADAVLSGRAAVEARTPRRGRHATVRSTRVHRPGRLGPHQTVVLCALLAFSAAVPAALLGLP